MILCTPIPVRIAHLDFVQDMPPSSSLDISCTKADKHTPYFAALNQWLDRSEKDDAIYAQAYSCFKPFEDEYDVLSASISSLDSSEGSADSESSTSGSPPSSVSALNVKHSECLSPSPDLQKLSSSTPPKPVSRTGLGCTLTLPTPISLSENHPPRIDEYGRLQPFEETQTERKNREDFVNEKEYARSLELMGLNAGVGADDEVSSEDRGLRHALVVPPATVDYEADGGAKEDLEELLTVNSLPRRRRHRPARTRTRPTSLSKSPSPAERQSAAHTIQLAYRSHLERTAVLATIIDEIESIAYEAREAFFSEIEREETKLPNPTTLSLYNTALTALSFHLSTFLFTLPNRIASHPTITSERAFIEELLKGERVRAEMLGTQTWADAMRRTLRREMQRGEELGVLEEEDGEDY